MIPDQPRGDTVESLEGDEGEEEREQAVGREVLQDGKGRTVDIVRFVIAVAGYEQ